jgi:hypothetical protein
VELGIAWFRYIPKWKDNRDLDEGEQLSLEIKRMKPIDTLYDDDEETVHAWRDEHLKRWLDDPEQGAGVRQMPLDVLKLLKRFAKHTRGFKGFVFDGVEKTDPIDIFLNIPNPTTSAQDNSLIMEIVQVLGETAHMTGDELKNFVGRVDGCTSAAVAGA